MSSANDAMELAARSTAYGFLAQAFSDPNAKTLACLGRAMPAAEAALATIGEADSRAAFAAVRRELEQTDAEALAARHHSVFGHGVSGDCPPYEGEYGYSHIFQKAHRLADNAGFIDAFGLAPAPGFADRLDHISVELEFMHVLATKAAYALHHGHGEERLTIVHDAMRKYFVEHLGRWARAFAARLEAKAQNGPYAALAQLLAAFVAGEARAMDVGMLPADLPLSEAEADQAPPPCEACAQAGDLNPAMRGSP